MCAFVVGSFYSTLGISRCSRVCGQTRLHRQSTCGPPSTLWNRAAVIRSPTPSAMRSCTVSARIRTVSLLAGSALFHRSCILLVGAQSRSIRDFPVANVAVICPPLQRTVVVPLNFG